MPLALRITPRLLLASFVGLLGCPQLLHDDFETLTQPAADGSAPCVGDDCRIAGSGGSGGGSSPGASAGAAGVRQNPNAGAGVGGTGAGRAGVGGTGAGGAGVGGTGAGGAGAEVAGTSAGSAGNVVTGGSGGSSSSGPACWTLELTGNTQDSSSNCLGIRGWNQIETDPDDPTTTVVLSYQNGDPCFAGTIGKNGWGATYDLTFANTAAWNATSAGVTGFNFSCSGPNQPASLEVIYKDASGLDFCHFIGPGDSAVPFSAAHPNCSTSAGSSTANLTQLRHLILAFPVDDQPYDVEFCVQLRALD